ncbi:MAG: hypothetical protein MPN21_27500 [Thermoanaerobaculia bacterium]|nr:hypothetical protein [Thermoanaerobaculia bacterium]
MGIRYSAFPIDSEVREWLVDEGLPVPQSFGRAPTPRQLQSILETLADQVVSFNINEGVWQAHIDDLKSPEDGLWTVINVLEYSSPDAPCEFYFEKGWPELIIKVAHRIAEQCGPIAIVPDTGCPAAVVEPDSDVDKIINAWEHLTA